MYYDPASETHWELSYPNSGFEGGGPPMLTPLSDDEVVQRYPKVCGDGNPVGTKPLT